MNFARNLWTCTISVFMVEFHYWNSIYGINQASSNPQLSFRLSGWCFIADPPIKFFSHPFWSMHRDFFYATNKKPITLPYGDMGGLWVGY
jgi:hypothetical protein